MMFDFDMIFETTIRVTINIESFFTTDETFIMHVLFSVCLFISQLCKCLNNDTEDNIQLNTLYTDEEAHLKGPFDHKSLFVVFLERLRGNRLTDTTTVSQTVIQCGEEAVHQINTCSFSLLVIHTTIVESIIDEIESEDWMDPNDDEHQ